MDSNRGAEHPIYLTVAGRRRIEDRLATDLAERARLAPVDPNDVRDSGDEADRLEAADQLAQLDDRIAAAQATLDDALPVPVGQVDGVVRLGSTVQVRNDQEETWSMTLVDPTEFFADDDSVSVDSPVGSALIGCKVGDRVPVATPGGDRVFEIVTVEAYRPA